MVSTAGIEKRWRERIVGKYDAPDGSQIGAYLLKYGKGISDEKLEKYAQYARQLGQYRIADAFLNETTTGMFKNFGERLPDVIKREFDRMYYYSRTPVENFDMFRRSELRIFLVKKTDFDTERAQNRKYRAIINGDFALVSFLKDRGLGEALVLITDGNFDKLPWLVSVSEVKYDGGTVASEVGESYRFVFEE